MSLSLLLVTRYTEGGGVWLEDSSKHCFQPNLNEEHQSVEPFLTGEYRSNPPRCFVGQDSFWTRAYLIDPGFELLTKLSSPIPWLPHSLFRVFFPYDTPLLGNDVSSFNSMRAINLKSNWISEIFPISNSCSFKCCSPEGKKATESFPFSPYFSREPHNRGTWGQKSIKTRN